MYQVVGRHWRRNDDVKDGITTHLHVTCLCLHAKN
jgi:hypothetical protein